MLTVEDIMKLQPLSDGILVAGFGGLKNIVDSVSVIEVNLLKIPEGQSFANGRALDISSMYSVMESIDDQMDLIRLLKARGNSGLVLCHVGIVIKEVSYRLVDLCNELDFPLIVMPTNIGYREIIESVTDALRGLENLKLSNTVAMYDSITALLMKDQSIGSIITNLSKTIDCQVIYLDRNLKTIDDYGLMGDYINYIREQVRKNTLAFMESDHEILLPGYYPDIPILLIPIYINIQYFGVIVILKRSDLTDLDRLAILQTKNALIISNLKRTDLFTERTRMITEYIDDLVHGYSDNERVIVNRSKALNHNVENIRSVIVVDIFKFNKLAIDQQETDIQKVKREFSQSMDNILRGLTSHSIGCNISDKYVILFSDPIEKKRLSSHLRSLGRSIQESVKTRLDISVSIGIGSSIEFVREIKRSYESALNLIRISNTIFKEPCISDADDFPAYLQLLNSTLGQEKSYKMIEREMLYLLTKYDNANNSNLVKTFRALLLNDMDTNRTAKSLYLHKNTVLQRKNKIIEVMGRDPFVFNERIQYLILILINDLLKNSPEVE